MAASDAITTTVTVEGQACTVGMGGFSGVAFQVTGTNSFSATVTFEATVDGHTFVAVLMTNPNDGSAATTTTSAGIFIASLPGTIAARARVSTLGSGTIYITGRGVSGGLGYQGSTA